MDNSLRFPGQYFDNETGLHYNYFRDYDPATGRYIESDPIGIYGGLNTYSYALENPVAKIDYWGLKTGIPWYDIVVQGCNFGIRGLNEWVDQYRDDSYRIYHQYYESATTEFKRRREDCLRSYFGSYEWMPEVGGHGNDCTLDKCLAEARRRYNKEISKIWSDYKSNIANPLSPSHP